MDRQILNFTVNEQILTVDEPIRISTNKVNYIQAHFDLGTNWSGYDSVRAVWFNDFNCISTVIDSLGNCAVPFEVMKRKGNVKVNLVGSISDDDVLTDRLTSYPVVAVIVDCTAQITGANTSPITPSEFEQFAQAVHDDADRAEQSATDSAQSATDAQGYAESASTSASNASESEDNAKVSELNAEAYKNQAQISAQNASESATDAEGYAEDAEDARDTILGMTATATTLPAGSDATASYSEGVMSFGIPRGDKGERGQQGEQGETGATPNISIGTVTTLDPDEDATATISGTAEEPILSFGIPKGDTGEVSLSELEDATVVQTLSDNEPYNYRRTNNGNGSGHREYDEIVGASVGWNQMLRNGNFTEGSDGLSRWMSYGISTTASNGQADVEVTAGNSHNLSQGWADVKPIVGHKYALVFEAKAPTSDWLSIRCGTNNVIYTPTINSTNWQQYGKVFTISTAPNTNYFYIYFQTVGWTCSFRNFNVVDLTLMNSAIADYVYSLEQSTAGSGVAWLKSHFPKLFDNGYQPFDSGSIKSVSGLTAHEMVGKNRINESEYTSNHPYFYIGKLTVGSTMTLSVTNDTASGIMLKIASSSGEIAVYQTNTIARGSTYTETITITSGMVSKGRLYVISTSSWDVVSVADIGNAKIQLEFGSIATDYTEYESHTYPLDSSVELRGQYKLNNGVLYADGDVYKSSGEVDRPWTEVALSDLVWKASSTANRFYATLPQAYPMLRTITMICSKYMFDGIGASIDGYYGDNKTIRYYWQGGASAYEIYVHDDSYSDLTSFVNGLGSASLVYPLATPTTDSATPYSSPQWCDSHGTEEYVGSELPVGHNTQYPMTLIDTADGLSNGTYEPRITVANGKKTVTWVSV